MTLSSFRGFSSPTCWIVTSDPDQPTCLPIFTVATLSEAWGHRLGVHKSEFGKSLAGDWSTYTPENVGVLPQDVVVSVAVARMFEPKLETYKGCIDTEHKIAELMAWQESVGFPFDVDKAHQLESKLRTELDALSDQMRSTFLHVDGGTFTPKRNNGPQGYVADAPMCKLKEFNPTSRHHIAWAFETFRGWTAKERTASGTPKIDDAVLREIGTDESLKFARILELQKHLGQLSEGKNAWLKQERDGRIHHSCILNTNTGRMAHLRPNLAQVPSDSEYRALFYPGKDRIQVGSDASGLELRCLGHYLSPFDGGNSQALSLMETFTQNWQRSTEQTVSLAKVSPTASSMAEETKSSV